jgi:hypothetical protein
MNCTQKVIPSKAAKIAGIGFLVIYFVAVGFADQNREQNRKLGEPSEEDMGDYEAIIALPTMQVNVSPYVALMLPYEKMRLQMFVDMRNDFEWSPLGGTVLLGQTWLPKRRQDVSSDYRLVTSSSKEIPSVTSIAIATPPYYGPAYGRNSAGVLNNGAVVKDGLRTSTLLENVPIEDSITRWAILSSLPRSGVGRVELLGSPGSRRWGGDGIGGAVYYWYKPIRGSLAYEPGTPSDGGPPDPELKKQVIRGTGAGSFSVGTLGAIDYDFVSVAPSSSGVFQTMGRFARTDGYVDVAANRRGGIDRSRWTKSYWIGERWRHPLSKESEVTFGFSAFKAAQGDGTPAQSTEARGLIATINAAGNSGAEFFWNSTIFASKVDAEKTVSEVSASRTSEVEIWSQGGLPTLHLGAAASFAWVRTDNSRTDAGFDVMYVTHNIRQSLSFTEGNLPTAIHAEASEVTAALFILHQRKISMSSKVEIGLRAKTARFEGTESVFDTNVAGQHTKRAVLNDLSQFEPILGYILKLGSGFQFRSTATATSARPVFNRILGITASDEGLVAPGRDLRAERARNVDLILDYRRSEKAPENRALPQVTTLPGRRLFDAKLRLFRTSLSDAIAPTWISNRSTADTWGNYIDVIYGNLPKAQLFGVELSAAWHPTRRLSLAASYQQNRSKIAADTNDSMERQLPVMPRDLAEMSATFEIFRGVVATAKARHVGSWFADSSNRVRTDDSLLVDCSFSWQIDPKVTFGIDFTSIAAQGAERLRTFRNEARFSPPRGVRLTLKKEW